jgi:hypothetical protein
MSISERVNARFTLVKNDVQIPSKMNSFVAAFYGGSQSSGKGRLAEIALENNPLGAS